MNVYANEVMARASLVYRRIMESTCSFRVLTNEGVDADDNEDGMRERTFDYATGKYVAKDGTSGVQVFQGFKYGDLPTSYVLGEGHAYA